MTSLHKVYSDHDLAARQERAQAGSSVKIAFHMSLGGYKFPSLHFGYIKRLLADFNNAAAQPCTLKTVTTQFPSPFSTEDMIARMCAAASLVPRLFLYGRGDTRRVWEPNYAVVSCPDPTPHGEEKGSRYNTTSRSTLEGRNQMTSS